MSPIFDEEPDALTPDCDAIAKIVLIKSANGVNISEIYQKVSEAAAAYAISRTGSIVESTKKSVAKAK